MNIDQELRDALRRKEAPRDLAERVLDLVRQSSERAEAARINEAPAAPSRRPAPQAVGIRRWLAAAAVFALAVTGADQYYKQQQAAETARVRDELRTALQITNDTLAHVQSKLSPPAENCSR
jgi:hypothetical protein